MSSRIHGVRRHALHLHADGVRHALRDLKNRNIAVRFGIDENIIDKPADIGKLVNATCRATEIVPSYIERIESTITLVGSPAVIRFLRSRGINSVNVTKRFKPEEIWGPALYEALQFKVIANGRKIPENDPQRIKYQGILSEFYRFAASTQTSEENHWINTTLFYTVELHHPDTATHSLLIKIWSGHICRAMGLSDAEIEIIRQAACLHDIGKIGNPVSLLNKPGGLNDNEYEQMKKHVPFGCNLLENCGLSPYLIEIVKHHHYPKGYPEGINFRNPPLGAKVITLVDTIEAATAGRVYEREKALGEVLGEIVRPVTIFPYDKEVIDAFIDVLTNNPTLVRDHPFGQKKETPS